MNYLYYYAYAANAITCIVIAIILLGIKSNSQIYNTNYVKVKNYMAIAAFIASMGGIFDFLFGGVTSHQVEIFNIPVLVVLYIEIIIFIISQISLYNSPIANNKTIFRLLLPLLILLTAYIIIFLTSKTEKRILSISELIENIWTPIVFIRCVIALSCLVLLAVCIGIFHKVQKEFDAKINNFFADASKYQMKWISLFFYTSAVVCIGTWLSFIVPNALFDAIVTLLIPIWFLLFTIKFINYQYTFHKVLSATLNSEDDKISDDEVVEILIKVNNWSHRKDKPYRQKDVSIENIAQMINVNTQVLSQYINIYCNSNFKEWIDDLRLEDAIQMTRHKDNRMTPQEIAILTGFEDETIMNKLIAQKLKEN